jgi:hypothetical protein
MVDGRRRPIAIEAGSIRHLLAISLAGAAFASSPAAPSAAQAADHCSEKVHSAYVTRSPEGAQSRTWHPPIDQTTGCTFGHEHGSNPRRFISFKKSGMPAFGWVAAKMAMQEPHHGFKVFVVNHDGRGKAFMVLLHQGSGGARRAGVSHHTLEVWIVDRKTRELVASTHTMADFGQFIPNCEGQQGRSPMRLIPAVGTGCDSTYESWIARLSVGGKLKSPGIAFDIENPTTRVDPADLSKTIFNDLSVCGPDPAAVESSCTGDRRLLLHPRWKIKNTGPSVFYTDVMGDRYSPRPFAGSIRQFVRTGTTIDERSECCGPRVSYALGARRDGVYRLGRTSSVYGFGDGAGVRWPN